MKRFLNGSLAFSLLLWAVTASAAESSGWQQFTQGVKKGAQEVGKAGNEAASTIAKGAKKGGESLGQLFSGNGKGNKDDNSK